MLVDLTRVHGTAAANKFEQALHLPAAGDTPWRMAAARMHQAGDAVRDEPVIDEGVLVDVESWILALEIAGAIIGHAVTKDQVLGAGRGANGIRLHEPERLERDRQ